MDGIVVRGNVRRNPKAAERSMDKKMQIGLLQNHRALALLS